jgi:hypothetical protein
MVVTAYCLFVGLKAIMGRSNESACSIIQAGVAARTFPAIDQILASASSSTGTEFA